MPFTPQDNPPPVEAPSRGSGNDATALVVDDDAMERMLLRAALGRAGFTVIEAGSGGEALELFEQVRPDVVMLDILMPGIDGFETCRRIRALPAGARTPVMMTTTLEDESSIAEAYAAGATDFVTKPVNYALLVHRARYILRAYRVLANLDALTGLPGRGVFSDLLDRRRDGTHGRATTAVLYIDLDRFRRINDTLGRRCGDELLLKVSQRLQSCLRAGDAVLNVGSFEDPDAGAAPGESLLARAGGNEFIISLVGIQAAADVDALAGRLLDAVSAPFEVRGEILHVTASIGIALGESRTVTSGTLIERAESAKDQVKRNGRNGRCFYDTQMNERARRVFALEKVLRRALESERFQMYFQPKVDLQSGRPRGMEALMRLDYPGQGMISPAEFIPVAEQAGLIPELDRWAIRESCRQAQRCAAAGLEDLRVAVNVSSCLFKEGELPRHLADVLAQTGLDPQRLEVELTERLLLENTGASLSTLAALRELGVSVSMDDFGTGYSALSYLKLFKVSGLKIDRSFIGDVTTDPDGAAIVSAIVGLGQRLGLTVTAEGVETTEQAAFLRDCGCHEAQGFLYARAMPVDDFIVWVRGFDAVLPGRVRNAALAGALPRPGIPGPGDLAGASKPPSSRRIIVPDPRPGRG
jgi:predicted signal transduction protein with EAL and GGDEF domain